MFKAREDAITVQMFPGVHRRTLTSGERTTLVEVSLAAGSVVPSHTHSHEQIGYVARGRVRFEIDGEVRELAGGDSYLIPGNAPHEVTALEDSVCIDIFSPPRTEYLD
jgi:quercetin dioxygenase-like cupin family protein